ncbi:hypothetical protein LDENG_00183530 [Lucifuga dentata]|nr:hypothetical protein LDENG_00183530 [Lucifuga dentata]
MEDQKQCSRPLKRRMEYPAGNSNKELLKRARNPPKRIIFYEPDPGSPKDDQDGLFVFLTFEDGYTAKIFKSRGIAEESIREYSENAAGSY